MRAYISLSIFLLLSIASKGQYQGGVGDGSNQGTVSAFLNGQALSLLFSGSNGDGFSSDSYSSFLNGKSLAHIFNGGSDDGFSSKGYSSFLDGNSLAQLYNGGSSDGFDQSSSSSFLDGTSLSLMFSGGISDGFDQSSYSSFLDGTNLSSLFSGGSGDGFGWDKNSQFVDGSNLSLMFAGGSGDGFSNEQAFAILQPLAYMLWTGVVSTDWETPSNWRSNNAPISTDDVVVDGNPLNQPLIDSDILVNTLDIQENAQVTVAGESSLIIHRNLSIFDPEGLILKSNSSSTGYSQLLVRGSILGSGTVVGEFYVGSNAGFRHVSSPYITQFIDLKVGNNLLVASNSNEGNLFEWDAENATWIPPASVNSNFTAGKGYAVFMGTNSYGTFVSSLPAILDLKGTVVNSHTAVTLKYNTGQNSTFFPPNTPKLQTQGWNLVGNPYPCAYDWDGQSFPTAMKNHGYAVWNPNTGTYAYYNKGTSLNSGSRYIAPYQGVFVQTTSTAALTFSKFNRTVSQSPSLLKTDPTDIVISVSDKDGLAKDEMIIGFDENATDEFDGQLDSWKLLNAENTSSLYSIENGASYAINRLAYFQKQKSVRIGFINGVSGSYSINGDLSQIDPAYSVELEDVLLDKIYDLKKGDYAFMHNPNNKKDRFILHVNKKGNQLENPEKRVLIFSSNSEIVIDFSQALLGAKKIKVYDVVGRELASVEAEMNDERIEIPISGRTNSYYVVQITSSYWTLAEKVFLIE